MTMTTDTATIAGQVPKRQGPPKWVLLVAVGVASLAIGTATGVAIGLAASDPTTSPEYQALKDQRDLSESQKFIAEAKVQQVESRAAELDQREAAVAAREAAVTTVEQQVAANSIEEGMWTVGVDVEPGTYRTAAAVSGDCYWAITRSGSNGSDIIDNDIVQGGFPTVTLEVGQDFENSRCGTFVRQ